MSYECPTNHDDVIDSRSILARIEELESSKDDDDKEELTILRALAEEAENYSEDWKYGETLIRGSYFEQYCKELCTDIGDLPKDLPSYIVIDWDATANNIRADYAEVYFGDVLYLVR